MDVLFYSKHFLSPQITHIDCTVGPAGCINLYLTPGYDSGIRAIVESHFQAVDAKCVGFWGGDATG